MNPKTFNRQIRQFRNLAIQINDLITSGKWNELHLSSRNRIISKLNSLYRHLCSFLSQSELRKILAAAVIFIGFPLAVQSQSFAPPHLNPFGLAPDSVSMAVPEFADIDLDGDYDLFTGNYGGVVQFFENTGTAAVPEFALPQVNPFGIGPADSYYLFPAFADIDNDGDLDLFLGQVFYEREYFADFRFLENIGTPSAPVYDTPQLNPFGLSPAYMFSMPEFADIDNDGDLDLFSGEGYGYIKFYENTGTPSEANFTDPVPNPFGLTEIKAFGSPEIVDIDHDGDLDVFIGEYYGNFQYCQNTGTAGEPAFAPEVTNPFGLVPTNYYNFPAIADLDDDGDEDILVGEYYGMFQYFKNTEINIGIIENCGDEIFDIFPNPATDLIYLSFKDNNAINHLNVNIIDMNGRAIQTIFLTDPVQKIATGNLASGVYFVRIILDDKVFSRRFIIKR